MSARVQAQAWTQAPFLDLDPARDEIGHDIPQARCLILATSPFSEPLRRFAFAAHHVTTSSR